MVTENTETTPVDETIHVELEYWSDTPFVVGGSQSIIYLLGMTGTGKRAGRELAKQLNANFLCCEVIDDIAGNEANVFLKYLRNQVDKYDSKKDPFVIVDEGVATPKYLMRDPWFATQFHTKANLCVVKKPTVEEAYAIHMEHHGNKEVLKPTAAEITNIVDTFKSQWTRPENPVVYTFDFPKKEIMDFWYIRQQ